jgi:hypothetical protein
MANQGGARHTLVVLVTKYHLGSMAYADADHGYLTVDWNWLLDTTRSGSGLANAGRVLAHEIGYLFHAPMKGHAQPLCGARTLAIFLSWCFCAPQAALRYSLIRPWTTWVRVIRAVISIVWPGSCSGGRCSCDWCGRCSL